MKKKYEASLANAINIIDKDNWISTSSTDYQHDENPDIVIRHDEKTEDQIVGFYSLSDEAKEVVRIVLNAPSEILEIFQTPKAKRYSKRLVKNYLLKKWHEKKVDKILNELKEYTKTF